MQLALDRFCTYGTPPKNLEKHATNILRRSATLEFRTVYTVRTTVNDVSEQTQPGTR